MPVLPTHDPLAIPATREQVNAIRDILEGAPVTVDGQLIDIDERSEKRLQDAIELWDDLETETLEWTMGDNTTVAVTKADLVYLLGEAKVARGRRAMSLHTEARAFKQSPGTTLRDLATWFSSYAPTDMEFQSFLKESGLV